MYFKSYTCNTELILVLRILFLCEGTRRYDESEQVRIISHTRSDQIQGHIRLLQIRTLFFRRYRSQIHYTEVTVFTTGLILIRTSRRGYKVYSYSKLIIIIGLLSFGTLVGVTELNQIQDRTYSDSGVPVGTTELNQIQEYPYVLRNLIRYRTELTQIQEYP